MFMFFFFDQRNGNVLLSCWCPYALSIDVPGLQIYFSRVHFNHHRCSRWFHLFTRFFIDRIIQVSQFRKVRRVVKFIAIFIHANFKLYVVGTNTGSKSVKVCLLFITKEQNEPKYRLQPRSPLLCCRILRLLRSDRLK